MVSFDFSTRFLKGGHIVSSDLGCCCEGKERGSTKRLCGITVFPFILCLGLKHENVSVSVVLISV